VKKIFFVFLLVSVSLFADLKSQYPSKGFFLKHIPIVDIRTAQEWKETGVLKGAIPITFFNQEGKYDANKFLHQLNDKVDTTQPFALICRTGHRTSMVAPWLAKEFGYKVINLKGGMLYVLDSLKIKTIPYKK